MSVLASPSKATQILILDGGLVSLFDSERCENNERPVTFVDGFREPHSKTCFTWTSRRPCGLRSP